MSPTLPEIMRIGHANRCFAVISVGGRVTPKTGESPDRQAMRRRKFHRERRENHNAPVETEVVVDK